MHRTVLARKISATSLEVAGYVMRCSGGGRQGCRGFASLEPLPSTRSGAVGRSVHVRHFRGGAGVPVGRMGPRRFGRRGFRVRRVRYSARRDHIWPTMPGPFLFHGRILLA